MKKLRKFKTCIKSNILYLFFFLFIKYVIYKIFFFYKITIIKAIYLTKLRSKFEVDITKIEVPMRFCLSLIPEIATG